VRKEALSNLGKVARDEANRDGAHSPTVRAYAQQVLNGVVGSELPPGSPERVR
jgi:hypothetical protein